MHEKWVQLEEFPDYSISDFGNILNLRVGGIKLTPTPNQYGLMRVGLVKDRIQMTRSLALLVAYTFVPGRTEEFNTPIHLDGDHTNCRADNLMWRTRSFTINYHKQFNYDGFHTDRVPVVDIDTGRRYNSMKEVCTTHGIYWYDVLASCMNGTYVPPTGQRFRNNLQN